MQSRQSIARKHKNLFAGKYFLLSALLHFQISSKFFIFIKSTFLVTNKARKSIIKLEAFHTAEKKGFCYEHFFSFYSGCFFLEKQTSIIHERMMIVIFSTATDRILAIKIIRNAGISTTNEVGKTLPIVCFILN